MVGYQDGEHNLIMAKPYNSLLESCILLHKCVHRCWSAICKGHGLRSTAGMLQYENRPHSLVLHTAPRALPAAVIERAGEEIPDWADPPSIRCSPDAGRNPGTPAPTRASAPKHTRIGRPDHPPLCFFALRVLSGTIVGSRAAL